VPNTEVVGYATACITDDGGTEVKLITSWRDIQGIHLNETAQLQPEQLDAIQDKLHDMVRAEFDPTRSVRRLERDNQRAGRCQLIFDLLSMRSLLNTASFSNYTEADNFWLLVKDHLEELINTRDELLIADLSVDALKRIKDELLFGFRLPQVEQTTSTEAPILYVKAAIDAGCRLAEAMKVNKAELSIGRVRSSIEREIEKQFKNLQ
jgi:hypothetical protein